MLFPFGVACFVKHCDSNYICSSDRLVGFPHVATTACTLELSDTDILPDAIVGLSTHCALNSRLLIERLVLNFPQKWCDVYERLLGCISATRDGLDQKQSARCLAMLHHLLTFVPDTNGLLSKCVSTTLGRFVLPTFCGLLSTNAFTDPTSAATGFGYAVGNKALRR